jgi:uncharacterized phage infection (PIP) family protein YhgE
MIPIPNLNVTLIAAALAFGGGWVTNGWRLNGKIDRMIAEHSQEMAKAGQNAMQEAARLQKIKDEALNEANRIAEQNKKAAAAARTELDRLRRQLASANDLSSATCPSTRDYAATLATVFGECASRISELAEKADGHAADSRTLESSFPRQ